MERNDEADRERAAQACTAAERLICPHDHGDQHLRRPPLWIRRRPAVAVES